MLLFGILLDEILEAVVGLATPIADLFPADTFERVPAPVAVAVVLILAASFLFGLATKLAIARKFGAWAEGNTVGRLPHYRAIKSLTSRFAAMEESGRFRPALSPRGFPNYAPGTWGPRPAGDMLKNDGRQWRRIKTPRP